MKNILNLQNSGRGRLLKTKKTFKLNKISNNIAFSLIELSIVLIIIGLLVAGITGGASLIESAKVQGVVNEFRNYRQAVYAFVAIKNRLPGDIDLVNKIGQNSGYVYEAEDFAFPYDGTDEANNHYVPDVYTGPWVELFLEGITDFEPIGQASTSIGTSAKNGNSPISNNFRDNYFNFWTEPFHQDSNCYYMNGSNNNSVFIQSLNDNFAIMAKTAQKIDTKIDDGIYNTGEFRGFCRATGFANGCASYEDTIAKNPKRDGSLGSCARLSLGLGI